MAALKCHVKTIMGDFHGLVTEMKEAIKTLSVGEQLKVIAAEMKKSDIETHQEVKNTLHKMLAVHKTCSLASMNARDVIGAVKETSYLLKRILDQNQGDTNLEAVVSVFNNNITQIRPKVEPASSELTFFYKM